MNITTRSLLAASLTLAVAVVLGFVVHDASLYLMIAGVVGALSAVFAGACPLPNGLDKLPPALGAASEGRHPTSVTNASPVVLGLLQQAEQVAETIATLKRSHEQDQETLRACRRAMRQIIEASPLSDEDLLDQAGLLDPMRQVAKGYSGATSQPLDPAALNRQVESLIASSESLSQETKQLENAASQMSSIGRSADTVLDRLTTASQHSSSSIRNMLSHQEKLLGEFEDLISHARETGTSIEEMAFSIREVAKNVDALALTAEETSSSMNEMDVAIDQVQSNATETTKLSEKVTRDAEQGAQAIMKTLEEIQRIEESTEEAVEVIAKLGTRIEAISGILRVIDDVAEQTNLLALNAAIIAAQAGEHGKGFAVVADEIKELADRAGSSTREIAELTRTIQAESKNAVLAVQRGAENVRRGVEVSNEAEYALKQILESSRKSTAMVQTIARATLEQTKGSREVTRAISTIAQTVQQIATTTSEQAKSSEFVMSAAETIRQITDRVERGGTDQHKTTTSMLTALSRMDNEVKELKQMSMSMSEAGENLVKKVAVIRTDLAAQARMASELQHTLTKH